MLKRYGEIQPFQGFSNYTEKKQKQKQINYSLAKKKKNDDN